MQNASLNIGPSFGSTLNGLKGKTGPATLGDIISGNNDGFKSLLLGGLAKSKIASAAAQKTAPAAAVSTIEMITIPADLLAQLQALRSDDLSSLSPELTAVFAPHMTAEGTLDQTAQTMIDTLADMGKDGSASIESLFLQDPAIAALFTQFTSALKGIEDRLSKAAATDAVALFDDIATKVIGSATHVTSVHVNAAGNGLVLATDKGTITVNAADLNADQFNAFKKLAFADLAPFLSTPRTVRIDPHTLMKSVQGPSFLDDENAPQVVFIRIAENVSAVPAAVLDQSANAQNASALAALQAQASLGTTASETPLFLDASLVARAASAVTPQTGTQTTDQALALPSSTPKTQATQATPQVFGRANLFAALLGLPHADAAPDAVKGEQTPATPVTPDLLAARTAQTTTQNASALATALQNATAAGTLSQGGLHAQVAPLLKGMDNGLLTTDAEGSDLLSAGFDAAFPVRADAASTAASASALLQSRGAGAGHPAIHLVSIALSRGMDGAMPGGADRQFTIQLDPENLGRVKITIEFGDNNMVKAKLVAERPETVALLQKDAVALERSLHASGFDVKADSLTFNLGGEGSFQGSMSHNGNSYQNGGNQPSDEDGTDFATIETVMPIFVDPRTGLTHVNIVV